MFTHNLDPVILSLGFISLRWYSLAYVLGILIGWWYGKKLISNKSQLLKEKFNLLVTFCGTLCQFLWILGILWGFISIFRNIKKQSNFIS